MSDITKCINEECTLKKNCYRHTAPISKFGQSYSYFNNDSDTECDWFWDNNEKEENVKLKADKRKKTD